VGREGERERVEKEEKGKEGKREGRRALHNRATMGLLRRI